MNKMQHTGNAIWTAQDLSSFHDNFVPVKLNPITSSHDKLDCV